MNPTDKILFLKSDTRPIWSYLSIKNSPNRNSDLFRNDYQTSEVW